METRNAWKKKKKLSNFLHADPCEGMSQKSDGKTRFFFFTESRDKVDWPGKMARRDWTEEECIWNIFDKLMKRGKQQQQRDLSRIPAPERQIAVSLCRNFGNVAFILKASIFAINCGPSD